MIDVQSSLLDPSDDSDFDRDRVAKAPGRGPAALAGHWPPGRELASDSVNRELRDLAHGSQYMVFGCIF